MTTKNLYLTLAALIISAAAISQKKAGTVNVYSGKAVFIEANPQTAYRHIGSVECSILSPDKFDMMMEHMVSKRVAKEYPEVEYDALIFRPNMGFRKADIVKFYSDPEAGRSSRGDDEMNPEFLKSETIARKDLNLFIENKPTGDYKVLGKIEMPQNFTSVEYQEILAEMIRVSKLHYPDLNGIIFTPNTGLSKAVVIKI